MVNSVSDAHSLFFTVYCYIVMTFVHVHLILRLTLDFLLFILCYVRLLSDALYYLSTAYCCLLRLIYCLLLMSYAAFNMRI